jgi:hypothetical protein
MSLEELPRVCTIRVVYLDPVPESAAKSLRGILMVFKEPDFCPYSFLIFLGYYISCLNFVRHQPKAGAPDQPQAGYIVAQEDEEGIWTKIRLFKHHKDATQ